MSGELSSLSLPCLAILQGVWCSPTKWQCIHTAPLRWALPVAGKGRLTTKAGSFFEGEWKAGSRVKGRWVSADRRQEYLGDWKGSVRHGQGTLHVEGLLQYTGACWVALNFRSCVLLQEPPHFLVSFPPLGCTCRRVAG